MTHPLAMFDVAPGPELGRGGSTIVYLGRHHPTSAAVAVKVALDPTDEATNLRIRHEATMLTQLHHPQLVPFIGLLESGHDVALLTAAAAAGSLHGLLATCGPSPDDRGISVARQLFLGVGHVHRRGIVHGDITPANILLPTRRGVWLADFDRARPDGDVHAPAAGTPRYVAPEVREGRSPHAGSDVWSAAGCCVELLTGTVPQDPEEAETLLAEYPVAIRSALVRALHPVPHLRPTATELVEALHVSSHPRRRPPTTSATTPPSRGAAASASLSPPPRTVELPVNEPRDEPDPATTGRHVQVLRCVTGAAMAVGFGLLALGAIAAGQGAGGSITGGALRSLTLADTTPDSPTSAPCNAQPSGSPALTQVVNGAAGTSLRFVRVDDRDCRSGVVWAPATGTLSIDGTDGQPAATFTIGRPGDRLLLGDWNADHLDEPAIYRPSTGMLYRFDGWAGSDAPRATNSVERTGVLDADVTVTPRDGDSDGDRIVVSRGRD